MESLERESWRNDAHAMKLSLIQDGWSDVNAGYRLAEKHGHWDCRFRSEYAEWMVRPKYTAYGRTELVILAMSDGETAVLYMINMVETDFEGFVGLLREYRSLDIVSLDHVLDQFERLLASNSSQAFRLVGEDGDLLELEFE